MLNMEAVLRSSIWKSSDTGRGNSVGMLGWLRCIASSVIDLSGIICAAWLPVRGLRDAQTSCHKWRLRNVLLLIKAAAQLIGLPQLRRQPAGTMRSSLAYFFPLFWLSFSSLVPSNSSPQNKGFERKEEEKIAKRSPDGMALGPDGASTTHSPSVESPAVWSGLAWPGLVASGGVSNSPFRSCHIKQVHKSRCDL